MLRRNQKEKKTTRKRSLKCDIHDADWNSLDFIRQEAFRTPTHAHSKSTQIYHKNWNFSVHKFAGGLNEQKIKSHSSQFYRVVFIGFSNRFPYHGRCAAAQQVLLKIISRRWDETNPNSNWNREKKKKKPIEIQLFTIITIIESRKTA